MRGKTIAIALGLTLRGLSGCVACAQGASSVLLPQLQQTAQVLALGDGAIHLEGLNALGVNPAALSVPQPEAIFQFQQLPQDTQAGLLGVAYPLRALGASETLGVTYLGLRSSGFDRRNDFGDASGTFSLQDRLIAVHASRPVQLDEDLNALDVGLSYKLLVSRIDSYSATAHAVDAGLRLALKSAPLTLGLSARNLGKGPDQESRLPTSYLACAAYRIGGPFTVLAGVNRLMVEKTTEYSLGFEAWARAPLTLRAHYAFAPGSAGGAGAHNLAGGLGLNLYRGFTMDYAFQPFDSSLRAAGAVGTHRMTLTMRFGRADRRADHGQGPLEAAHHSASERIADAPRYTTPSGNLRRRFDDVPTIRHAPPSNTDDFDPGMNFVAESLQAARQAAYDGRYKAAIQRCKDVLNVEPRNARALSIMGTVYYLMEDMAKAKAIWTRAHQIDPDDKTLTEALRRFASR